MEPKIHKVAEILQNRGPMSLDEIVAVSTLDHSDVRWGIKKLWNRGKTEWTLDWKSKWTGDTDGTEAD